MLVLSGWTVNVSLTATERAQRHSSLEIGSSGHGTVASPPKPAQKKQRKQAGSKRAQPRFLQPRRAGGDPPSKSWPVRTQRLGRNLATNWHQRTPTIIAITAFRSPRAEPTMPSSRVGFLGGLLVVLLGWISGGQANGLLRRPPSRIPRLIHPSIHPSSLIPTCLHTYIYACTHYPPHPLPHPPTTHTQPTNH